jgi:hypothetical protein
VDNTPKGVGVAAALRAHTLCSNSLFSPKPLRMQALDARLQVRATQKQADELIASQPSYLELALDQQQHAAESSEEGFDQDGDTLATAPAGTWSKPTPAEHKWHPRSEHSSPPRGRRLQQQQQWQVPSSTERHRRVAELTEFIALQQRLPFRPAVALPLGAFHAPKAVEIGDGLDVVAAVLRASTGELQLRACGDWAPLASDGSGSSVGGKEDGGEEERWLKQQSALREARGSPSSDGSGAGFAAVVGRRPAALDTAAAAVTAAGRAQAHTASLSRPLRALIGAGLVSSGSSGSLATLTAYSRSGLWAEGDEEADAEAQAYVTDQRQAAKLPQAALVLQAAWRARGPRLKLTRLVLPRLTGDALRNVIGNCACKHGCMRQVQDNLLTLSSPLRFLALRRRSGLRLLQPAWASWRAWCRAAAHERRRRQRAALAAWRELTELRTEYLAKVLCMLRRSGALAKDGPVISIWALCAPVGAARRPGCRRPCLGALLGAILTRQYPLRRMRAFFSAWRQYLHAKQSARSAALAAAAAKGASGARRALLQTVSSFWRAWAQTRLAERLGLPPALPTPMPPVFCDWIWRHQHSADLRQRAISFHTTYRTQSMLCELDS